MSAAAAALLNVHHARAAGQFLGGQDCWSYEHSWWKRLGAWQLCAAPLPVLMSMLARARRTATHLSVAMVGPDLVVDLGLSKLLAVAVHHARHQGLSAPVLSRIERNKFVNAIIHFGDSHANWASGHACKHHDMLYESSSNAHPLDTSLPLQIPATQIRRRISFSSFYARAAWLIKRKRPCASTIQ